MGLDVKDGKGAQAKPPEDASETVLAEERKTEPPAPGADKVVADQPVPAEADKPLVDMTSPESRLPKPDGDGKPVVVEGDKLVIPGPPGQPDTTGGEVVKAPGEVDDKLKGEVTTDSEFDKPYNAVEKDDKAKLPPDVEKEIALKMEEYKKSLDDSNFTIKFGKGEGPNPAMFRQQQEAMIKQKEGKPLSPQEKAVLGLTPEEIRTEAIRMRDRDFKVLTTKEGKPRNWYIKDEPSTRWSPQELKEKMAGQEKALRENAVKEIKEAEAKAREAEAEKQRQQLAQAIEKNVPSETMVKDAATKAGVEGDPKVIRDAMKAHVAKEVADGSLKPEDLSKPYPRVGAALVGTGALTGEELKSALTKQAELKTAAEANGGKGPRLDAVLQDIYKDNPEKLAAIEKGSKFYDELKKIVDEDLAKKKADAPPADPFKSDFNTVPKETGTVDTVVDDEPVELLPPATGDKPPEPVETLPPDKPPVVSDGEVPADKKRAEILKEVTEKPKVEGVVTDLKQAPSGYLALRAFMAGGLENRTWSTNNPSQKAIVDALNNQDLKAELPKISPDVLDGIASVGDAKPINDFFERKNLDLRVENLSPTDIALASTLNVKGQWAGTRTEIDAGDGKKFPGVALKGAESFQVGDKTVVKLYSGDDGIEVYATPMEQDASGEELLATATSLTPNANNSKPGRFSGARLPMVQMDARTSLDGMVGMRSDQNETVTKAEMQTKLNIDEHGFSVDQGLSVLVSKGLSVPNDFTFDKPFLLWVKTKDGSQPLTAIRVDERFWKDPKGSNPSLEK